MKRLFCNSVFAAIVILAATAGMAQSRVSDNPGNQIQVHVANVTVVDLSPSKLVIGINLAAHSPRDVTVDKVIFSGLELNGVPVSAVPFKRRFKLRSGDTVALPEPLQVTLYLRDLDSLKPLRDAISAGYATLNGTAEVHVPLNPVARLMLLSSHAEVSTSLHQQVPFSIPGGPLAAASLVKILDLADAAFETIDSTITGAAKLGGR